MDRDYYDDATSYRPLRRGLRRSCRNVRWKDSVVGYEANAAGNTVRLSDGLRNGTYRISPYQRFVIYEPKRREILAARLVDRQFQRSLCDSGLYEDITEHFIRDSYACQVGRGTDDALDRMSLQLRRYHRRFGCDGWALKCDVRHFFASIPHDVAKEAVRSHVSDERAARAVCDVIDSFGGDRGLGLGSQISQLVALAVLDPLDHLITERLGVRCYGRYMDDFILVHEDREHLRRCRDEIGAWLRAHGLELNGKTTLQPLRHGFWFLQWRFVLTDTGRVLRLMDPGKLVRWRRRLRRVHERELLGEAEPFSTWAFMLSSLVNVRRGNTHRIERRMVRYYRELTGDDWLD